MEEEGWSEAKKVAPKLGPRVFWRRRGAIEGPKVTTRQPRNQTPMVRRRNRSGPKRYPRKRGPMVFWRRSAEPKEMEDSNQTTKHEAPPHKN